MPILVRSPRSLADLVDELPRSRRHAGVFAVVVHRAGVVEHQRDLDQDRVGQIDLGECVLPAACSCRSRRGTTSSCRSAALIVTPSSVIVDVEIRRALVPSFGSPAASRFRAVLSAFCFTSAQFSSQSPSRVQLPGLDHARGGERRRVGGALHLAAMRARWAKSTAPPPSASSGMTASPKMIAVLPRWSRQKSRKRRTSLPRC